MKHKPAVDADPEANRSALPPIIDVDAALVDEDMSLAFRAMCDSGRQIIPIGVISLALLGMGIFTCVLMGSIFGIDDSVAGTIFYEVAGVCAVALLATVFCVLPEDNSVRVCLRGFFRFTFFNPHWPHALWTVVVRATPGVGLALGFVSVAAAVVLSIIIMNAPSNVPVKRATLAMWVVSVIMLIPTGALNLLRKLCDGHS
jgi:uncharacterized membrane protein YuzA (DUF378 family)